MAAPHVCIIATGARTWSELQICLTTLETWHPDARVYIATDSAAYPALRYSGSLTLIQSMAAYAGLRRADMEAMPGRLYPSLFTDFTFEKAALLQHVLTTVPEAREQGVWFLDADITLLAPLPAIPATARIALSPHAIRAADEARYGRYNAGFLWVRDPVLLDVWRAAGHTSHFYEQAALEAVAGACRPEELHEFPPSVNFGWWRMYQADAPPATVQSRFSLHRSDRSVGIRYGDVPLQSVHTHWYETTGVTGAFNTWFCDYVGKFRKHAPLARLLRTIRGGAGM